MLHRRNRRAAAAPGTTARRARQAIAVAAVLAATTGGIAACGKVDAKVGAQNAMDNLKNSKAASFTLRLDDPAAELVASSADGDDPITKEDLAKVTSSSLRVVIDPAGDRTMGSSASPSATPTDAKGFADALKAAGGVEFDLINGGKTLVGIRFVDGVLYLKLDASGLSKLTGEKVDLNELKGAGVQGVDPIVDGVAAGKWVSLDVAGLLTRPEIADLFKQAMAGQGAKADTKVDPMQLNALVEDLRKAMAGQVRSVEKVDGEQIRVDMTVKVRDAADALLEVLSKPAYASLVKSLSAGAAAETGMDSTSAISELRKQVALLPDGAMTGAAFIKDDHLRQLRMDLAGIAAMSKDAGAKKVKTAAVVIDVDDSADALTAPASGDVVSADSLVTSQLGSLGSLMSMAGGGMGGMDDMDMGDDEGAGSGSKITLSAAEMKKLSQATGLPEDQLRKLIDSGAVTKAQLDAILGAKG